MELTHRSGDHINGIFGMHMMYPGVLCKSLGGDVRWDTETLTLNETRISLILQPILDRASKPLTYPKLAIFGYYFSKRAMSGICS